MTAGDRAINRTWLWCVHGIQLCYVVRKSSVSRFRGLLLCNITLPERTEAALFQEC